MSGAFTSAGTRLSISATFPSEYSISGFQSLTFVEIGEVTDLGEFGRQYNLVTHNPLADRRTVKRKGSYNDGTISAQMARVPSDEGQAILTQAVNSDNSYALKIVLQDGTTFYMSAQIMSYTTNVGNVDQITGATVSIEIDNDIFEVVGTPPTPPTSLLLTPSAETIQELATVQLTLTVSPSNASSSVTYTSSDPAVATVSQTGLVTGVSEGVATITATSTVAPAVSTTATITVEV